MNVLHKLYHLYYTLCIVLAQNVDINLKFPFCIGMGKWQGEEKIVRKREKRESFRNCKSDSSIILANLTPFWNGKCMRTERLLFFTPELNSWIAVRRTKRCALLCIQLHPILHSFCGHSICLIISSYLNFVVRIRFHYGLRVCVRSFFSRSCSVISFAVCVWMHML